MGEVPKGNAENSEGDNDSSESSYSLPRDTDGNIDFDAMTVYSDYHLPGLPGHFFNLRRGWVTNEDQPDSDSPADQDAPDA